MLDGGLNISVPYSAANTSSVFGWQNVWRSGQGSERATEETGQFHPNLRVVQIHHQRTIIRGLISHGIRQGTIWTAEWTCRHSCQIWRFWGPKLQYWRFDDLCPYFDDFCEKVAEEIFFIFHFFDDWSGIRTQAFESTKPTYYILDYGDFSATAEY